MELQKKKLIPINDQLQIHQMTTLDIWSYDYEPAAVSRPTDCYSMLQMSEKGQWMDQSGREMQQGARCILRSCQE